MIREVRRGELSACAELIRKSFQTVADEFGFTRENAPRFTAFATTEERLIWQMESEHRLMYLDEEDDGVCGYYSLLLRDRNECELGNLSVLPEFRHRGIGGRLLHHAIKTAGEQDCTVINLSIVEENIFVQKRKRSDRRRTAVPAGEDQILSGNGGDRDDRRRCENELQNH